MSYVRTDGAGDILPAGVKVVPLAVTTGVSLGARLLAQAAVAGLLLFKGKRKKKKAQKGRRR
jgi:hypothetical protein